MCMTLTLTFTLIYSSIHPSIHPSVHPSIHPSIRPSIRPSVRPSVCPFVRLSVRPFVRPWQDTSVWDNFAILFTPFPWNCSWTVLWCQVVCAYLRTCVRPSRNVRLCTANKRLDPDAPIFAQVYNFETGNVRQPILIRNVDDFILKVNHSNRVHWVFLTWLSRKR